MYEMSTVRRGFAAVLNFRTKWLMYVGDQRSERVLVYRSFLLARFVFSRPNFGVTEPTLFPMLFRGFYWVLLRFIFLIYGMAFDIKVWNDRCRDFGSYDCRDLRSIILVCYEDWSRHIISRNPTCVIYSKDHLSLSLCPCLCLSVSRSVSLSLSPPLTSVFMT